MLVKVQWHNREQGCVFPNFTQPRHNVYVVKLHCLRLSRSICQCNSTAGKKGKIRKTPQLQRGLSKRTNTYMGLYNCASAYYKISKKKYQEENENLQYNLPVRSFSRNCIIGRIIVSASCFANSEWRTLSWNREQRNALKHNAINKSNTHCLCWTLCSHCWYRL